MTNQLNSDNQEITQLFSELSNPLRMKILYFIQEKPMNTSQLAKNLKTTIQNLQRHLNRMLEYNLITKSLTGEIHLTSLGDFTISLIPTFTFILKNKEYFKEHTFAGIPLEFLLRLGELKNSKLIPEGMELFETAIEMNKNVKEFAYGMATLMPTEQYTLSAEPLKRGAKFRIIFGKNTKIAKDFYNPQKRKQWQESIQTGQVQEQFVEFLPVTVHVNESNAMLSFANRKTGQSEMKGIFYSKDPDFRKWCMDLSYHYWKKVEKIKPIKIKPTE